ncbi:nucleotidyltransferase domain-containing protein [Streptosporangium sp. V21-05]|uniref:nucleotidyltransferase domain-containing protein n=1 Tax=Streptosporangium sp. V21-05 TaxID=3446115 RepID=UPI003F529E51
MFEAGKVPRVLALLRDAGCEVWVAGGWGIDALVDRITREHRDLDLVHRVEREPLLIRTLESAGFAEQPDVSPGRPARFVMTDRDGDDLDLHPLLFASDGSAVQRIDAAGGISSHPPDCFVTGVIDGVRVPCLSAAQQVHFHQGYDPGDRDLHDMALLRDAFGITTHF